MIRALLVAVAVVLTATAAHAEDKGPFDVTAYRLRLSLDWTAKTVSGVEAIDLRTRTATPEFGFSDNALEIVSVLADGTPAQVRRGGGRLVVVFPVRRRRDGGSR